MTEIRCPKCMALNPGENVNCKICGQELRASAKEVYHLAPHTVLQNRYEIGITVGYGGFGIVYKAWDRTLEEVVAIKECYPTAFLSRMPDGCGVFVYNDKNRAVFEMMKKEFLEEARRIAGFNAHPNIVHIFDFFEENDTAYFVMEYLDGLSLRDLLKEARREKKNLDVNYSVSIAQGVLNGLKEAHANGVIHRDIKPGNIILMKDGTVKLFDFGSARLSDEDRERTRTAVVTPGYAPPEQYQKKSKQGPRTDIYAVGALLYEMLTGVKPEESINRKVKDEVVPPDRLNGKVPKNISNAVMRAMAISPEVRFASAEQFMEALLKRKGNVRDAKAQETLWKLRRNLIIVGIAAGVFLLGFFAFREYQRLYRNAVLAEASIELWAPSMEGLSAEETEEVYQRMTEEFLGANEQILVDISVFDREEYQKVLEEALRENRGPDLFESTGTDPSLYTYFGENTEFFSFSEWQPENYCFYPEFESFFTEAKQIPLTFDAPILYENTMSPNLPDEENYKHFLEGRSDYIGSADDLTRVQTDMAGAYTVYQGIPEGKEMYFTNLWSIDGRSSEAEQAAALRLLYYFLSDNAEEILTLENTNHIPLNQRILTVYTEVNPDFEFLTEEVKR